MLKYFFNGIAGFVTIVSALYIFLTGITLYIALFLSFLFTLGTVFAWYQSDRLKRIKAIASPLLAGLLKNIGAEVIPMIVEIAKYPGLHEEVTIILAEVLRTKPDPTERQWIYVALGNIGGKKAISVLKKGLSDENELAQHAAQTAWKSIKEIGRTR